VAARRAGFDSLHHRAHQSQVGQAGAYRGVPGVPGLAYSPGSRDSGAHARIRWAILKGNVARRCARLRRCNGGCFVCTGRRYETADTRSGRSVAYRLRLRLNQPGRMVIETANIEAIKKWGLTIYGPEGLDTLYFLSERSPGVWAYYT